MIKELPTPSFEDHTQLCARKFHEKYYATFTHCRECFADVVNKELPTPSFEDHTHVFDERSLGHRFDVWVARLPVEYHKCARIFVHA
jgi:hypothetical protein